MGSALRRRATAVALLVALVVTALGYAVAEATDDDRAVLGPGVVTVPVDIEHSRFSIDDLRVRPATLVRFVVDNQDPIHHELVVGPATIHEQHEDGTELAHPPVPGEVSVGPTESGMTVYRFDQPGNVTFACHLPGHVAYGMTGTITVVE